MQSLILVSHYCPIKNTIANGLHEFHQSLKEILLSISCQQALYKLAISG